MTWTQAILIAVIAFAGLSISGAIREAGNRICNAIDGNSFTLGVQNRLYLEAMDDETKERASQGVESMLAAETCNDPGCPVHGKVGDAA